ncbi:Rib/alpha-like domain-containing protein, partial [Streptococcus sp. ZJ100]|uniref:Rib/alpha-like domain-containing protein n=1 Tax=Streptococcus handemini TaxID=3161188 RepID=UPI0032EF540D
MFFKRQERFSIRKFKVGVFSVFLGATLIGVPTVFAESPENGDVPQAVAGSELSSDEIAVGENVTAEAPKEEAVASSADGVAETALAEEEASKLAALNLQGIPQRVLVANANQLTEEEKAQIKELVLAANPAVTSEMIVVTDKGEVIVTYNGKSYRLPATAIIEVRPQEVAGPSAITAAKEEEKVADQAESEEKVDKIDKPETAEKTAATEGTFAPAEKELEKEKAATAESASPESVAYKADVIMDRTEETPKIDVEKAEAAFELVAPNRIIPVVDVNQLKESEKERVKNLILRLNKSLSDKNVRVEDNGDVFVTLEGEIYYLPGTAVVEAAADMPTGTGFRIGEAGSFYKAFGYRAERLGDSEVANDINIAEKKVTFDSSGNATITYKIHTNQGRGTDVRGRIYFIPSSYAEIREEPTVELLYSTTPRVARVPRAERVDRGRLGDPPMSVTLGRKMNVEEFAWYKGLLGITSDDTRVWVIDEATNPTKKEYMVTVKVYVTKANYERHGRKVYLAAGVATHNRDNSGHNRIRFEETAIEPPITARSIALWTNTPVENDVVVGIAPVGSNQNSAKFIANDGSDNNPSQFLPGTNLGLRVVNRGGSQGAQLLLTTGSVLTSGSGDNATPHYTTRLRSELNGNKVALSEAVTIDGVSIEDSVVTRTANQSYNRLAFEQQLQKTYKAGQSGITWGNNALRKEFLGIELPDGRTTNDFNAIPRQGDSKIKMRVTLPSGHAKVVTVTVRYPEPALTGSVTSGGIVYNGENVPSTKVVTPNLTGATVSTPTIDGLRVDANGNLAGMPNVNFANGQDEKVVELPVTLTRNGRTVTLNDKVSVTVRKPVVATPTSATVIDGDQINRTINVLSHNQAGGVSLTAPTVNGLTVNNQGRLVGTPSVTFTGNETSKEVVIPVTVAKWGRSETVNVRVTVNKKVAITPIPKEVPAGVPVTPGMKVVEADKPNVSYTTLGAVEGLNIDANGNLTGTPTATFPDGQDSKVVNITVIGNSRDNGSAGTNVPITVYRPLEVTVKPDGKDIVVVNGVETNTFTAISHNQVSGADVTTTNPYNLRVENVNGNFKLIGEANVDFADGEISKNITIPVTVTKGKQSKTVDVPITINKKFELTAIPKEVEAGVQVVPNTKVVEGNIPNVRVNDMTGSGNTSGLSIDRLGNLTGTPNVTFRDDEDSKVVTLKAGARKQFHGPGVEVDVPITVNKPLVLTTHTVSIENGTSGNATTRREKVVTVNQNGATLSAGTVDGLTINADGYLTGTPNVSFNPNEDSKVINIPVTVSKPGRQTKTENVAITVYKPLAATANEISLENGVTATGQPALTVNQTGFTVSSNSVSGLSLDRNGNLIGTPNVSFNSNEESKVVTLRATVSKADYPERTSKQVDVPITIYKSLDATTVAKEGINGVPVTPTKVVTPNQDGVTITPAEKDGLRIDENGNVSGTPSVTFGPNEDSKVVTIPVTISKDGLTPKTVDVVVTVNKSEAEKTTPAPNTVTKESPVTADGLKEEIEKAVPNLPDGASVKVKEGNTIPTEEGHHDVPVVITYKDGSSEEVNVPVDIKKPVDGTTTPATAVNGVPVTPTTVVTPNQDGVTITPNTVSGLTVDGNGAISGTPTGLDFNGKDSVEVTIPVTLHKDGLTDKVVNVTVTVNKSEADKTEPTATPVTKESPVTEEGLKGDIEKAVPNLPDGASVKVKEGNTIPTEEGHHDVPVVITYKDGSSEEVNVPVDIKKPVDGTT